MKARLLIATSMLCWSAIEALGAFAGVSPYQVVWTRYGTHVLFMLAVFAPRHGTKLIRSPRPGRQIVRSLLMLGMPLCFVWSAERITVHNTMAVFWISPLLVIALTALIGSRGGGMQTTAAALAGFMGAILIYRPDRGVFHYAAALALGMAFCFAAYLLISRAMKEEFILGKLFHTALWVFACLCIALPRFWRTPSLRGWVSMAAIGVLGWFALFALDRAIELAPPACLAPVLYTQLLWILLIEALFRIHLPGVRAVAGMLLIASGLAATLAECGTGSTVSPTERFGCSGNGRRLYGD